MKSRNALIFRHYASTKDRVDSMWRRRDKEQDVRNARREQESKDRIRIIGYLGRGEWA
jgi:predicted AAA+ superfamily ATPase